jgi:hypothetical protein
MAASSGTSVATAVALAGILLTAIVAVFGYLHTARVSRRERVAHELAEALRAVGDYQNLPFRIRRRKAADAETRASMAELASDIHSRLDFHAAWLRVAAPAVSKVFDDLVRTLRHEVDPHAKAAWLEPVIAEDAGMNLGLGSVYATPRTEELKTECAAVMRSQLRTWWPDNGGQTRRMNRRRRNVAARRPEADASSGTGLEP